MFAVVLPFAYAGSWLLGAPAYWLIGRFTRNPFAFLVAGVGVGAATAFVVGRIGTLDGGAPAWIAGYAAAALVHWFIVARR
jgi:hypothetical protein